MNRFLVVGFLLLASLTQGYAQAVRLSDKADQFLPDIQKLMATGTTKSIVAGKNLDALWNDNRLSDSQKNRVMVLSRRMNARKLAPGTYFAPFFDALYNAVYTQKPAVLASDIDNLLLVAEKTYDVGNMAAFAKTVETMALFLDRRQVYAGRNNQLYTLGGTFVFRYIDPAGPSNPTAANKPPTNDGWDNPPIDSTRPRPLGKQFVAERRPLPVVTGPVLSVKNGFLAIVANGDSVMVNNTDMDVLLQDGLLVGKGGKFTWEQAGRDDIFVTLSDYALRTLTPGLTADDALLTAPGLFPKPISGVFDYFSRKRYPNQVATQPRFVSWQNDIALAGLGREVTYRGGLGLTGTTLTGASAGNQMGVLTVLDRGKPAFRVSSPRFSFTDSTITASSVAFVGWLATDSLTHPAVGFRYDKAQRVAWLNRIERSGYASVPYQDSYHKFFILPEVLRWDVPRRKIDFYQVGAKSEVPVLFESYDYFRPDRYADLAENYGFHPVQIAGNYVSVKHEQTFLADDLARFAKLNPTTFAGAVDRMVLGGYFDRDPATELLRLSRKGALYVLANAHLNDYDNFRVPSLFVSNDSIKNATISLNDNLLTIRGVKRFVISDSLKIFGFPTDRTLHVGKNRSFVLNGQLKAGNFRYAGRDLAFDYDKFSMGLNKIDSITFVPQKLAAQGRTDEVGGDIKYEKPGTVILAAPDNKSGQMKDKKITQRLIMPEGMTVYFNQPIRGDTSYNQRVFFKIPAIDNDSIGKGDISFIGTFFSDGIVPPFKAELKTMPDNTLGFVHKPPVTGYPLYGSKTNVKFTGDLVMNRSGLHSTGTLNHLMASLSAEHLLFMTDSLMATGSTGEVREGVVGKAYYPAVVLRDYALKWWPKRDSMVIATKSKDLNFYNGTTKLEGAIVLQSTGMFGRGTLRRADSETESQRVKFNKEGFLADNARFRVIDPTARQEGRPMLLGNAVDVDFNQVKGVVNVAIKANTALDETVSSSMEFPNAAYKTNINRARWNINARTIAMQGDVKTSTFTATGPDQEGLSFNGGAALYDVEKATLNISGVPFINSADARIFPDKGVVTIRRNGEMLALKNARLELDTISLHHKLKNGNIQILSRTRFAGDATYQFVTAVDTASIKMGSFELREAPRSITKAQPVVAPKPEPEPEPTVVALGPVTTKKSGKPSKTSATSKVPAPSKKVVAIRPPARRKPSTTSVATYFTVARAEIEEADNLLLAPKMAFKGKITMLAPEEDLQLDGFIKPTLKKRPDLISGWIPFKEKVQEDLQIRVDKTLKNEGGQPLLVGIHYRTGSGGLYPTFLSPKESNRDEDIFTTTGIMHYDPKEKLFRVEPAAVNGTVDEEKALTFNDSKGVMTFAGRLNLMSPQPVDVCVGAGSARVNVDSITYRLNTMLAFNFPVPDPITAAIGDLLIKTNLEEQNDDPADDDLNTLSDRMEVLIGRKPVDDYRAKAQNQHVSLAVASPVFNTALVLSDVNLRWSERHQAFYSVGRLGVSNLGPADVNARMNGLLEVRKTNNGDELSVYIEASPDVWVFYNYRAGSGAGPQLAIVTSEQETNDRITAGPGAGGKSAAAPKVKSPISVVTASVDEKTLFIERYFDQFKLRPKPAPKPKPAPVPVTKPVAGKPVVKPVPGAPAPKIVNGPVVSPTQKAKKKDKEDEKEGF